MCILQQLWEQIDHKFKKKIDREGVGLLTKQSTDPAADCRSDIRKFAHIAKKFTCLKKDVLM